MFIDEATVEFRSGNGGDGAAAFLREKHVPRGGPHGADGGRGGDVTLVADRGMRTLLDFTLKAKYAAANGEPARSNKRGRDGQGIEVHVPVGTVVQDLETGETVVDLNREGMRFVVCRGGKGGLGNAHFATSVRQAPTFAQKGMPGEALMAKLELKLLADVGLVGLPNAGKSTLLSRLTAARPKIADYPFTTIVPNLGVVRTVDSSFVLADLPGLIEGAAEGHGLGHQFLKHVERTKVLLHVVDLFPLDETQPLGNYHLVRKELGDYDPSLTERPEIVALNKTDLVDTETVERELQAFRAAAGVPVFAVSGVSGQGLEPMLHAVQAALVDAESRTAPPVLTPVFKAEDDGAWDVEEDEEGFVVVGKRIERIVAMTDLENNEAVRYLHRRLERMGVINRLRDAGAEDGDNVRIGDFEFEFQERG